MNDTFEANIDCLAGPTHHFGGHAYGNIASLEHRGIISHPKKAALQGLEKMKLLFDLGVPQIVLPPHPRPNYKIFKQLGFEGSLDEAVQKAYNEAPALLLKLSSSSAMWAANSATVTPSHDAQDNKVHVTCANLVSNFHRSIEVDYTLQLFKGIFKNPDLFTVHDALPQTLDFSDEGAANHTRFSFSSDKKGVHLFVYGASESLKPTRYPARQTKLSQETIIRLHKMDKHQVVFAQQNPAVIDKGVFHNDVISTGFLDLFIYHEDAFVNRDLVLYELQKKGPLKPLKITKEMLSVEDAVRSYLFNSQIVLAKDNQLVLIAPTECEKIAQAKTCLEFITQNSPIKNVIFLPLQESMFNGGGPACLRLRVPLTQKELNSMHQGVIFTENLYNKLKSFILSHYPDEFTLKMLLDSKFIKAVQDAYSTCLEILELDL